MRDSIKANLIVFLIIALIAFGISSAFANLTIHEDNDSYKLIPVEDDSFEPSYIYKVPTIIPKNTTTNTTTNITNDTVDDDDNDDFDLNETEYEEEEEWNDTYTDWNETYEKYNETQDDIEYVVDEIEEY